MLLSAVPLMWKPASQLQCWVLSILAQRGLRLKAGSFVTLHAGGAKREKTGNFKVLLGHLAHRPAVTFSKVPKSLRSQSHFQMQLKHLGLDL